MAGLIVLLPLPHHIDRQAVLNAVPLVLDVDTTGAQASQLFYENKALYAYPTALAVLAVLDSLALDLSEKKIVMVGQGMLVGKPVTHMLRARGLDVTVVDRDTPDPTSLFKNADVLISAVGKPHFITKDDLKQGVIVIDAGTSELEGGVVGDIDPEGLSSVASAFSPVPGGVGPVTVAMLMQNIVQSAEKMK